jgi:hypothetical protein
MSNDISVAVIDYGAIGNLDGVQKLTVDDVVTDDNAAKVDACPSRRGVASLTRHKRSGETYTSEFAFCDRLTAILGGDHGLGRGVCLCCAAHGDPDESMNAYLRSLALRTAYVVAAAPVDEDNPPIEDVALSTALSAQSAVTRQSVAMEVAEDTSAPTPDRGAAVLAAIIAVRDLAGSEVAQALCHTSCLVGRISPESAVEIIDSLQLAPEETPIDESQLQSEAPGTPEVGPTGQGPAAPAAE